MYFQHFFIYNNAVYVWAMGLLNNYGVFENCLLSTVYNPCYVCITGLILGIIGYRLERVMIKYAYWGIVLK